MTARRKSNERSEGVARSERANKRTTERGTGRGTDRPRASQTGRGPDGARDRGSDARPGRAHAVRAARAPADTPPDPAAQPRPKLAAGAARERVDALRRQIREHDRHYYDEASPEISDEAYDALVRELRELEAAPPDLVRPDSPTQHPGGAPDVAFPTVRHAVPMLSLDNTYNVDEVRAFHQRLVELLQGAAPSYVVEPKLDGVAVSVIYADGRYHRA